VIGNKLYAGGAFLSAGGNFANCIAKWDGTAWSALGSGLDATVKALEVIGGDLYVGGLFTTAGGGSANRVAVWDGATWGALGSGVDNDVYSMAVDGTDLYVGGSFTNAGGSSAVRVAKWNGAQWSALGQGPVDIGTGGPNLDVNALVMMSGTLIVGGKFSTLAAPQLAVSPAGTDRHGMRWAPA
jgi:hypothetical protein